MSDLQIYYTEFKGANALYAKLSNDDYLVMEKVIRTVMTLAEDEQCLEILVSENKKLPRVSPKGRHKRNIEFLAGLTKKTLQDLYSRDFTVKQLEYLNEVLAALGIGQIEFIHGTKPQAHHELFHKLFG